jgi:hypothetical protein
MPANGCLRVLDPTRGDEITYARQSRFLVDAIPLSDISNIILASSRTPEPPFLSEPEHTWCYYYAKAELAYQQADWDRVVALIDQARSLGYEPEDPFEWLTYIEAQARTGNRQAAQSLSKVVFEQDKGIRKGLCQLWQRVQTSGVAGSAAAGEINQTLSAFQCTR